MFRKIPALCLISFIWLFSAEVTICLADEEAEIYRAKENICFLIEAGKFTQARSATDKLTIEFAGYEKLPEMLYWVAERYKRFDRFEDAKRVYQQMVGDFHDSPWADKARIAIASADITILIIAQNYDKAREAIDKLAVDYASHPDTPMFLYWNAVRFYQVDRFEDAKQVCQRIIDDFPDGPWAGKARFCIARADLTLLIISRDYEQAGEALDKMVSDFAGHLDLPEALYWIAERYERLIRPQDARRIYQQIIEQFPHSTFAKKAKLGISRAEAISLVEAKDYNDAKAAIDKMRSDFAGHPDLPETLYWIAERYKAQDRAAEAKLLTQTIVQNYSGSPWAGKESLNVSKDRVISLIMSERYDEAKTALDKFMTDFAGRPQLPEALFWITERYQRLDRFEEAKENYQRIITDFPKSPWAGKSKMWLSRINVLSLVVSHDYQGAQTALGGFITDFAGNPELPEALFWITERYQRQDRFEEAKQNYQKIIDGYPNSPWATKSKLWLSRVNVLSCIVSQNYDGAGIALDGFIADFAGNAEMPEALYWIAERYGRQNKIEQARNLCQKIVNDYPDSPWAAKAKSGYASAAIAFAPAEDSVAEVNVILVIEPNDTEIENIDPEVEKQAVELYQLAREYEASPDKAALAVQTYTRVIEEYPGTIKANNAALDIRRLEIWEALNNRRGGHNAGIAG